MTPLDNMLLKYSIDNNPIRLTVILESFGKQATKPNLAALKLLIGENDKEVIAMFLGDKSAEKSKEEQLQDATAKQLEIEKARKPHQDDLEIMVKRIYGEPSDSKALGNRVLTGETLHFHVKTNIYPSTLLDRFALMAHKQSVALDFYPNFGTKPPTYECAIAGTHKINRVKTTRVD